MAKHPHDDDSQRTPIRPPRSEDAVGADAVGADAVGDDPAGLSAEETHIGKKPPRTQIGRKNAPPTQLASNTGGPDTPPKMPSLSIDEDEIVEAESIDEEVIEAQPASGAGRAGDSAIELAPVDDAADVASASDEDVLAADVESGSSLRRGAESPPALEAHPASDIVLAEAVDSGLRPSEEVELGADVVQEAGSAAKPESDIQREAADRRRRDADRESAEPAKEVVAEDAGDSDESSAVDFGRLTKGSSSNVGVDPVAEALESGVNLQAAPSGKQARMPATPLDDQLAAQGAPRRKRPKPGDKQGDITDLEVAALDADHEAAEAAAADLLSADEAPPSSVEDEAAALLSSADDMTEAPPSSEETRAADERAEEEPEDQEPKPKKKKKVKREPALAGAGATTVAAGRGGRGGWLGGTLVGILLTAGAAGAVWYFAPDLIPDSPNAQAKPKALPAPPPPPPLSLAQQARAEIDQSNYDAALDMLKDLSDTDKTPANLTARADARWLKYQKEQAEKKTPLSFNDEPVKAVLADLDAAKNELVKNEVIKTVRHDALNVQVAIQAPTVKALAELQNALAQAKIVGDKAGPKEIATAVTQALAGKEQAEKRLADVAKALVDAKQIESPDKLDAAAVQKLAQAAAAGQNALNEVNKLLASAQVKEQGLKGIAELVAAKKSADDKLAALDKALKTANTKAEGAEGLKELVAAHARLQKERQRLDQAVKAAYKELAGDKLPAGADPTKDLVAAVKAARQQAESPLAVPLGALARTLGGLGQGTAKAVRNAFDTTAVVAELNYYRLREPLIQQPAQRLDTHIAVFEDRGRTAGSEQALKDAQWVLSPAAKASPEAQAKAHYVIALVKRNQQQFADAQKSAQAAAASLVKAKSPGTWVASFKQTQQELADPAAYYLPRIDQAQSTGDAKNALAELGSALKALPDNPRLLAQRALLQLEGVSGQGKSISAAVQKSIRADAAGALKDPKTAPEGQYVIGLLEEELGRFDEAEKHLRSAVKAARDDEAASRYRLALGRVLLQDRVQAAPPPPAPKKPAPKTDPKPAPKSAPNAEKQTDKQARLLPPSPPASSDSIPRRIVSAGGEGGRTVTHVYPLDALVAALALGQVDTPDPAAEARIQESIKLAQELINSENRKIKGQGHMLLGQALSKQGKRTEGLREYIKGVELAYPGIGARDLNRMIDEHPAFQQPDVTARPNPYLAEAHFGKGLHLYWSNLYPEAEALFKQAVEYYGQDARYQYYLGLAQYGQSSKAKRDAAFHSFEVGARLEADNRPPVDEVNASLERVQGANRRLINHFRTKALEPSR